MFPILMQVYCIRKVVLLLQYYITDRWLLVKTGLVLAGVILCFFLHSFIDGMHIDLGTKPFFLLL